MKSLLSLLAVLALALSSASCVGLSSSESLADLSERMDRAEEVLEDETASVEEVEQALVDLREAAEEAATSAVEGAKQVGGGVLEGLAGGGLTGGVLALFLQLYRTGQRKKRGEPTSLAEAQLKERELEDRLLERLSERS